MNGKVYLVGAGPGDPDLITVKGIDCIKNADVLVYDYLASPSLLKNAEHAEIIYVGKQGGDHTLAQDKINDLLVEKASTDKIVTRLKGGDSFIFGRGGEEAEVLVNAGIPFEIVPGITSGIAAPAYAGIPLTHRNFTSTMAFITGHEDPTKKESNISWPSLAKGIGTLVFFMGVKNLPNIVKQLITHGKSSKTPIALIRWGTTARQQTISGTLENIVEKVQAAGLKPPAIIVVGKVVSLREKLKWFEKRPLWGHSIVVTRARKQASNLINKLSELGADCIECPTIEVVPPKNQEPVNEAVNKLNEYDWLIFTSVNGVSFFFNSLFALGKDVRALKDIQTASIGPATAKRLMDFGLKSDIIPKTYRAESIIEAFENKDVKDKKVLLPRAEEARPILPAELRKMGAVVDEITAYRTKPDDKNANILLDRLKEKSIDLVSFTSSSTVKNFKALLPLENFSSLMENVTVAAIGPITANTAKELGFEVHIVAEEYTIPGLIAAILKHFQIVQYP
ncbi:uroporphyrinogen III methyltransferase / synthase [Candidatus Magnetomoraceae bacterium gMMP-15]